MKVKGFTLHYCKREWSVVFNDFVTNTVHTIFKLGLAAQQAKLLGTSKYSAAELAQEMYESGYLILLVFGQKETSVNLSGLTSQLDAFSF